MLSCDVHHGQSSYNVKGSPLSSRLPPTLALSTSWCHLVMYITDSHPTMWRVLHCPHGFHQRQPCPRPDVVLRFTSRTVVLQCEGFSIVLTASTNVSPVHVLMSSSDVHHGQSSYNVKGSPLSSRLPPTLALSTSWCRLPMYITDSRPTMWRVLRCLHGFHQRQPCPRPDVVLRCSKSLRQFHKCSRAPTHLTQSCFGSQESPSKIGRYSSTLQDHLSQ